MLGAMLGSGPDGVGLVDMVGLGEIVSEGVVVALGEILEELVGVLDWFVVLELELQ